jgi:putative DNA primase/helicase
MELVRMSGHGTKPRCRCGSVIEELRNFVNVRDDEDFMLVVAWLVAALRPRGPYPILVANGEQGSGKSVFCRMLRLLVDPGAAAIRAAPKDDRDLVVSASNSWILAFDNSSRPNTAGDLPKCRAKRETCWR